MIKAAILNLALAYLHPYFDGNGQMARLLYLWYLVQQGYSSTLIVPMSCFAEESRSRYLTYTQVEQNQQSSGVLDVTPFLVYFAKSVYHRLGEDQLQPQAQQAFEELLRQGITSNDVFCIRESLLRQPLKIAASRTGTFL